MFERAWTSFVGLILQLLKLLKCCHKKSWSWSGSGFSNQAGSESGSWFSKISGSGFCEGTDRQHCILVFALIQNNHFHLGGRDERRTCWQESVSSRCSRCCWDGPAPRMLVTPSCSRSRARDSCRVNDQSSSRQTRANPRRIPLHSRAAWKIPNFLNTEQVLCFTSTSYLDCISGNMR